MKIDKIAKQAEKAATECRYARINWNAHLVPVVRSTVEEFGEKLKSEGYKPPYFSLLSEAVSHGEISIDPSLHLGDSITVQFGIRPIASNSLVPLGRHRPILIEERAALVFSQASASGSVVVLIYPPSSVTAKPSQQYYLVGSYQNPSQLTKSRIEQYLNNLFEVDLSCSTQTAPSIASSRQIIKLEARATAIQSGNSGIFAYFKYITYLVRAMWRLYRASHASP